MSLIRFLIFDGLGSLLWAVVFVGLGYVFSDQFEEVVEYATSYGSWFGAFLIFGLGVYFGWKIFKRQSFLKSLRTAQIQPEDLKIRIEAGEDITIIDLREALDFELNPNLIPTALRMSPDEIEHRHQELPKDRDIILYCS